MLELRLLQHIVNLKLLSSFSCSLLTLIINWLQNIILIILQRFVVLTGNLPRHSVCEPMYHNFESNDWDNLPLPPLDTLSESGELPPLPPPMSSSKQTTFLSVLPPCDATSTLPSYEPDYNVVSQPPKFSTFQRRSVCETRRISPNGLSDPECDWKGAKSPTLSSLV